MNRIYFYDVTRLLDLTKKIFYLVARPSLSIMAQSKPKSRFNGLALVLLLSLASVATVLSESIETPHKTVELDNGGPFPRGTKNEERAASARELFWVNNKHLPEWQDFKYQQRIQRKRKRRRRNMNGPFKKPNRWNGTGFRMETMNVSNRMNMNMMGMNMMQTKKRMKTRNMMNTTNTNLNFQPIMTRGMMKMRPMRANTWSSDEARSDGKRRMELTWDELAERRMNMRKRANRRFQRRQWRMQQRRNEKNEQEYGSDDYSKADSDSSSSSSSGSSR